MNIISITGNVTRDAETRYSPSGDAVANFSVADNQGKDKQAIFWNCQLWGKRAEALAQYLTKGQAVTVNGEVTEREWADKDGNKRKTMEVRVTNLAMQGGKRDEAPRKRTGRGADQDDDFGKDPIPF